jgi:hypothetical protein
MANWKETDLRTDLAATFFAIDPTSTVKQTEDAKGVTWMTCNVLEVGLSEKSKKPTSYRKNVEYYVYHRGQADEVAWYSQSEPINSSNTDVTIASSSYAAMANLYNSPSLQARVLGAIITQCTAVFLESGATTNHANRMKLVSKSNIDLHNVVMQFMSAVAQNATVQAAGNAVADSVLLGIVSGAWDSFANLIVA